MATRRQQNFLGQQRVDVSDLRAIESGVAADFDIFAGKIMAGRQPLVVRGFTIGTTNAAGNSAELLQLSVASGLLLHFGASESGTIFMVEDGTQAETLSATNPKVRGGFIANSVNYVGLDLVRSEDPATSDLKQFLDADTKLEIPKTVPVARTLDYNIIISTQPFSITTNICPIAKVETNTNNNVTAITDSRNLMFRLGSGGDSPNALDSFTWPDSTRRENNQYFSPPTNSTDPFVGGDKGISSVKDWMDAVMTRLWEVGSGEYWYRPNNRDAVKLVCAQPVFTSTQDNWEWTSGSGTLAWKSLYLAFENSTVYFNNISDGAAILSADGQCLYVDLQRSSSASALVPAVATLVGLGTPTTPGSRFILAWRIGGQIYVRDRGFEVGRPSVVATPTVLGVVKLSRAATTPLAPIVLADSERNATNGVAGLDSSQTVLGTGLTRDASFGAGAVSVGTGANDSSVSIAKSGTTTTVNGALAIKDAVDTAAANTMTVGGATQTGLTVGRAGAPTSVAGSTVSIDSAGSITVANSTATSLTVGRTGAPSTVRGSTITVNGAVTTDNNITIPAASSYKFNGPVTRITFLDAWDLKATTGTPTFNGGGNGGSWQTTGALMDVVGHPRLPQGATITAVHVLASNLTTNPGLLNVVITIRTKTATTLTSTNNDWTASVTVPASTGDAWYTQSQIANTSLPSDSYVLVDVSVNNGSPLANVAVKCVRITYTVADLTNTL